MNKSKIKTDFLNKIELFYRNFGSDWEIKDFSENTNVQAIIKDYLKVLEKKGIIEFIDDIKFRIIDLPSRHKDFDWE
ncbi:hypothetical protein EDM00_06310 [Ornithobacterium rhinotracheale]|uniref:hypothetical protein n=1 Tax=Ornithobacterium rhinotracheale TaxID=28251 RepID=UPI00129C3A57|nr:hypothetical protein [Ornithobacterium rhinotracheale]MRI63601.1 hypothetical protein [Ornithobacterium rhinotracheale]MRJ09129.1 hypothetical protein [Ornithobacterium rhinotracheale]UOH78916.1 hypothetical protein MT996_05460 [Ornithobacterium rhinotracheale]